MFPYCDISSRIFFWFLFMVSFCFPFIHNLSICNLFCVQCEKKHILKKNTQQFSKLTPLNKASLPYWFVIFVLQYTILEMGFPAGSDDKESACNTGDLSSIPELGGSPGEGQGNPLQYSCQKNPHGQRSLVGYSPWCRQELDTTERLSRAHTRDGCRTIYYEDT